MKSKLYQLLLTHQLKSGFTLIELLAASMMTFFVVVAASYGTMVVMRENTASSVASDTQYNLNRAADYITGEIKSATSIFTTFPTNSSDSNYTQCNVSPYIPILGIKSGSSTIVYCLKQTNGTEVWLGKNVIYRAEKSSTGNSINALVDLIADIPQSSDCQNSGSGWTKIPTTPKGFFVCVDSTGKMVELHLSASAVNINSNKAQTTAWMGSDTNTRFGDKATYEVVTQVYARAPSDVAVSVSPTTISGSSGGNATFTFSRGGVLTNDLIVNFSVSGTAQANATATTGKDYQTISSSSVTIAAGSQTATLAVPFFNTATAGRFLTITVTSGTGYQTGGSSSGTVTVN